MSVFKEYAIYHSNNVDRIIPTSSNFSMEFLPSQEEQSYSYPIHSAENLPYKDGFLPRSACEANFITNSSNNTKFRQLPCRTFISVGTCPYRERCVYLHDPRIICREAKTKTRRKNKEDNAPSHHHELDSLYWPIMPYALVAKKLDSNRQPHVIQPYLVPPPEHTGSNPNPSNGSGNESYRLHDQAVYSMWMHFVDYCMASSESRAALSSPITAMNAPCFSAPDMPTNSYTNGMRLPTFRALSRGHSFSPVYSPVSFDHYSFNTVQTQNIADTIMKQIPNGKEAADMSQQSSGEELEYHGDAESGATSRECAEDHELDRTLDQEIDQYYNGAYEQEINVQSFLRKQQLQQVASTNPQQSL